MTIKLITFSIKQFQLNMNWNKIVTILLIISISISCKKKSDDVALDLSYTHKDIPYQFGMAVPHFGHSRTIDISTRYNIGVRWVRRDFVWENIERTRGVFDFKEADDVINREIANNVQVLGILNYSNLLYISEPNASTSFPPDTLQSFGNYVTQTVKHFKDRVHIWEIWNEPNGPTFWKPNANPKEYGELVLIAIQRIREADPNAKIMLGGMVGNSDQIFFGGRSWGFTEDLLSMYPEIVNYIDIYSVHPYTFFQKSYPEERSITHKVGFMDLILDFRTILEKNNAKSKTIWATEYGWHNAVNGLIYKGVPEDTQAAYLVRASVLALSLDVEMLFPYTYRDGPEDLTVSEAHFGMYRYAEPNAEEPFEPKPSAFAYQTMTQQLGNKSFTKDLKKMLKLDNNSYAYQFEDIIVAWTTTSNGASIQLLETPKQITNIYGENIISSTNNISISQMPIYIKF